MLDYTVAPRYSITSTNVPCR